MLDFLLTWLRRAEVPGPCANCPQERPAAEPLRGCGWFDSSHELRAGLLVREDAEAAPDGMPLSDWLERYLTTEGYTAAQQGANSSEASSRLDRIGRFE